MTWTSTSALMDVHVPGLEPTPPARAAEPPVEHGPGQMGGDDEQVQPAHRLAIGDDMDSVITEPDHTPDETSHTVSSASSTGGATDETTAHESDDTDADTPVTPPRPLASDDDCGLWPRTAFHVEGVSAQPAFRGVPAVIISQLRQIIIDEALREPDVDVASAHEFANRLSQGTLVLGFIISQLDTSVVVDPATRRAAELFRRRTPLADALMDRLDRLIQVNDTQVGLLHTVSHRVRGVHDTALAIEQATAYAIADRSENFLRGTHDPRNAPITHPEAIFVRDRVRQLTDAQQTVEKERAGRPLR